MTKVAIVGAGNVGGAVAARLAATGAADEVALIDVAPGLAEGTALDIAHAGSLYGSRTRLTGSTGYEVADHADAIVVTAGRARRPGESRADLTAGNAAIVRSVVTQVAARAPFAVLIVVTNPLDEMTHLARRVSGFPVERVMGMAGVLDSARYRHHLAQELGGDALDVDAITLGSHGDTMVPVPSLATYRGTPVTDLLPQAAIEAAGRRTRDAGAEIVRLLRSGSAFHAPGASVAAMVASILDDQQRTLPVCAWLSGQYGISEVFLGVPATLGRRGVGSITELPLTQRELEALRRAATIVADRCRELDRSMLAAT
jgi:malate dehydrogenase